MVCYIAMWVLLSVTTTTGRLLLREMAGYICRHLSICLRSWKRNVQIFCICLHYFKLNWNLGKENRLSCEQTIVTSPGLCEIFEAAVFKLQATLQYSGDKLKRKPITRKNIYLEVYYTEQHNMYFLRWKGTLQRHTRTLKALSFPISSYTELREVFSLR